ncbi:sulfite exporter TauE/SafE family protein [Flavobacterium sp. MFBS3-15]|uniref:sulfite exporter TauE/SafE family protein n=1 Tax=Flavobacterium sp. MFBS3-15 TaxID=2989816 RepID=UPI00278C2FA8|nr:sulfite exporter TauE/SafE family protein [Flavobacterium sp. MFBS3-15]
MMEVLAGYCGAFIIGLTLGLMGSGGSILTVPLLVYLFCLDPVIATAYSLFVVGTTSAVGAIKNHLDGNLAFKTGLLIAIPSFIAVYATRRYIVTRLPEQITFEDFTITRHVFIMVLFALVMIVAAASMLFRKIDDSEAAKSSRNIMIMLPYVIFTGIIMGLVGAGGGFLIIPMLVYFGGLGMKKAVGTSLFIITLNSLTGFVGDVQHIIIDWPFLLSFTTISVFGIFAGTYLHKYITGQQLKKGFGIFVLSMAAFILVKELMH